MMVDEALWASLLQQLGPFDLLGVLGALLYMANYTRLVMRSASYTQTNYFAVNLVAAALVLAGLTQTFNLGAAMIQIFFVAMSLIGIFSRLHPLRRLRRRRPSQRSGSPGPQAIRWVKQGVARPGG